MNDFERDRKDGFDGASPRFGADPHAYEMGQEEVRRLRTYGPALGPVMLIACLFLVRFYALVAMLAIAITGVLLWVLMPPLGARPGWWQATWDSLRAFVLALLGVVVAALIAFGVAAMGGPDLIPNMHLVANGTASPLYVPLLMASGGYIFTALGALVPAVWWLDRELPETSIPRLLRLAVLAAVPVIASLVGFGIVKGLGLI